MINRDLIKKFAQKIDQLVDFTKIIKNKAIAAMAEMADGYAFVSLAEYLNEKFGDKIPVQYLDEVEAALQCFIDGDYAGMLNAIPEGLDEVIDIKAFDDDFEAVWLATNFNAAVKFATWLAETKLKKSE